MTEYVNSVVQFGYDSIVVFWIPLTVWTLSAGALFVCVRAWRRAHSQMRYIASVSLLLALPLGIVLIPVTTVFFSGFPVFLSVSEQITTETDAWSAVQAPLENDQAFSTPSAAETVSSGSAPTIPFLPFAAGIAVVVMVVIASISLLRLFLNILALKRLRRTLLPVTDRKVIRLFDRCIDNIGIRRAPLLLQGSSDMAPMTFGWIKPVVALPETMIRSESDYKDLRICLVHELMHVRRSDFFFGSITQLIAALFRWHPLVNVLKSHLDTQRELACDADVVSHDRVDKSGYAKTLVRVSQLVSAAPCLSITSSKKVLTKRIRAMQFPTSRSEIRASRKLIVIVVVLFLILPAFLTSCSVQDRQTESIDELVIRLEAEVGYLDNEIKTLGAEIEEVESDSSLDRKTIDSRLYWTRSRRSILNKMRLPKQQELELARMNVAVEKVLSGK